MIVFFLGSVKVGYFYILVDLFILFEWIVKIIESFGVELLIYIVGYLIDVVSQQIQMVLVEELLENVDGFVS